MKILTKSLIFLAVFYILSQLFFSFMFPARYIYNSRLNYDVFKDNIYALETTVKAVKAVIDDEKPDSYVIFIGDSVGYGTPCPPDKTMSAYMNEISRKENSNMRVFNLGIPSSMFGDFYTVILLLHKYGISTDNLILNFSYWEINAKTPAYWLKHYLKDLDRESYDAMIKTGNMEEESLWENMKAEICRFTNINVAAVGYSGFISSKVRDKANSVLGQPATALQVWSRKPALPQTMSLPENRWFYSDQAFKLDQNSPQIYFLDKIAQIQKGRNTIFFMNAMNDELLAGATDKEGFRNNLAAVEKCFSDRGLNYIDYNNKVDYDYFSDHIHLLPEGYKYMAEDLWRRINDAF